MAKEKKLKATHKGKITIGENELSCAVLADGTRVISRNAIFKAFGRSKRGRLKNEVRVPNMPSFIDANNLQPFIGEDLRGVLNQIEFEGLNGKDETGYSALILPMLCKVYLDARAFVDPSTGKNAMKKAQIPLARASEILLLGLSNVGITALIDEATGYQYEREAHELQKILSAYISTELLAWQQRFPHEFYKEIFRLRGWEYTAANIKNKPSVVGHWTNRLIYEQLPVGILKELKKLTPKDDAGKRKHHFHRLLTDDVGHPHLQKQIVSVVTLMSVSDSWEQFIDLFNKKFGQQKLEFGEIEIIKPLKPTQNLSGFNHKLKTALNYNQKKKK